MFMAITLDEIVEEAAQLPEDVVAELIERIVVSHHGGIEPGIYGVNSRHLTFFQTIILNRARHLPS